MVIAMVLMQSSIPFWFQHDTLRVISLASLLISRSLIILGICMSVIVPSSTGPEKTRSLFTRLLKFNKLMAANAASLSLSGNTIISVPCARHHIKGQEPSRLTWKAEQIHLGNTVMHPCLLVSELASCIAEACAPEYKSQRVSAELRPGLATVCALARTCRALQRPALDVIWYYQFGLYRLISCMPEDLVEDDEIPDDEEDEDEDDEDEASLYQPRRTGYRVRFARDPIPSDWERFDFYAKRVRRLEYKQGYVSDFEFPHTELAVNIYEALRARASPVLPCVQEVWWTSFCRNCYGHSFRFLPYFFSSTLTSVRIYRNKDKDHELADALASLPMLSPHISNILMQIPLKHLDTKAVASVLGECKALQKFELVHATDHQRIHNWDGEDDYVDMDSHILSELATLPKLRVFGFLERMRHFVEPRADAGPIRFALLEELSLQMDDAKSANALLQEAFFPSLKKLSIWYHRQIPDSIREIPALVRSHVNREVLEVVSVTTSRQCSKAHFGDVVLPSTIWQPLLELRNLRNVTLRPNFGTSICDADLDAFARAWPQLERLVIVGDRAMENTVEAVERPTYKGVASIVQFCPNLVRLGLVIAETSQVELENLPASRKCGELEFWHSTVDDVDVMASWVAEMFPQVRDSIWRSTFNERMGTEVLSIWTELTELVKKHRELLYTEESHA